MDGTEFNVRQNSFAEMVVPITSLCWHEDSGPIKCFTKLDRLIRQLSPRMTMNFTETNHV